MRETKLQKWFKTFFEEKNLSSKIYEVTSENGTVNMIDSEIVIDTLINRANNIEQARAKNILVKIDFMNGDIHHFLNHLAGALAVNMAV